MFSLIGRFIDDIFKLTDPMGAVASIAVLVILCACSTKISSRIHLPVLLIFLGIGMLSGEEGIGKIALFAGSGGASTASFIGSVAMAYILFSGGFSTKWSEVKPVRVHGLILSTAGVLLTALFAGAFTFFFLNLLMPDRNISFAWCFLLGSIISSTDAAAVFSILRSRGVGLKGDLKPLLELESGSNDPMATFLTIFLIGIVQQEAETGIRTEFIQYLNIIPEFLVKMVIGVGFGAGIGWLMVKLYNWIDFDYDGLYYVLGTAVVMISFAVTDRIGGNGFMAVYVTGLFMGNQRFMFRNGVGRFADGTAWLMQVVLFAMLGLISSPAGVWASKWHGLTIALALMLFARPAAVFLCMAGSRYSLRERILTAWVGLRGGAPVMLATLPMSAGISDNKIMFNIVFFIVIASVFCQGTTLMPLARLLKLDAPVRNDLRRPIQFEETNNLSEVMQDVTVPDHSAATGKRIAELNLPDGAHVLLIRRGSGFVMPRGDTVIEAGDQLMMMGNEDVLEMTGKMVSEKVQK